MLISFRKCIFIVDDIMSKSSSLINICLFLSVFFCFDRVEIKNWIETNKLLTANLQLLETPIASDLLNKVQLST